MVVGGGVVGGVVAGGGAAGGVVVGGCGGVVGEAIGGCGDEVGVGGGVAGAFEPTDLFPSGIPDVCVVDVCEVGDVKVLRGAEKPSAGTIRPASRVQRPTTCPTCR